MAEVSKSDQQIEQIVESIKDYGAFLYYYENNECWRNRVNNLYLSSLGDRFGENGFINEYYSKTGALGEIKPIAALAVHNNFLTDAQSELSKCLQLNSASSLNEANSNNIYANINSTDIPSSVLISPFDRRLDRVYNSDDGKDYNIIPISTAFADSITSSSLVSKTYLEESKVKNKDNIIKGLGIAEKQMKNDPFYNGVPALTNNYAHIKLYGSKGGQYLINQKSQRKWYEVSEFLGTDALNYSQNPTTTSLISWGNGDPHGRTPYSFSDFVFCKYWKKVQNNRMITLRRYAAPILDNLKFPGMNGTQSSQTNVEGSADSGSSSKIVFPPMATAITYFGEETDNKLSDILKFTTGFEWGDVESNLWEVYTAQNPDSKAGPGNLWPGLTKFAEMLNVATGDWNNEAVLNAGALPPDPYKNGPYENRIIGPVNRITKVKKRNPGIKFEMSGIELKFDYIARPIGGINTKAVLLDILSNFLIIGSTSAMFWGGQHRFMADPQRYPFLGGDKGIKQWYSGKPLEWGATTIESIVEKSKETGSNILKSAKNFFNSLLKGGDGTKDILGSLDNVYSGKGVGGNLIKNYVAEKSSGQIPYLTGLKALLIGEPVGEWHVTIGNPLNPIAMIGNLICESIQVEFGNELGPDDFPLEMRITVKLEHGMARDRDAIQSIFNRGMGRIYDIPDGLKGSAEDETNVDKVTGETNKNTGRNPVYYRVPIASRNQTGGTYGVSVTKDDALEGDNSVWVNNKQFVTTSPNSDQILRTDVNPQLRSSFKAKTGWIAQKSLQ